VSICERNIWDVLGRSVRETFLTREAFLWVSVRETFGMC